MAAYQTRKARETGLFNACRYLPAPCTRVLTNAYREKHMTAAMHHSVTALEAMRTRLNTSTVELFSKTGRRSPVQKIRYQIVGKGPGAYHIKELATGKTVGWRNTWKAASNFAQQMELRADAQALIIGSGFES
jgi:hypothetical protein